LARRRLQESAELASDERAVELTEDPVGLARSLVEVAAWGLPLDARVLGSPVVSERRTLLRRVRLLLDRGRPRGARWLGPVLVAGLAVAALSLPALGREGGGVPPTVRAGDAAGVAPGLSWPPTGGT